MRFRSPTMRMTRGEFLLATNLVSEGMKPKPEPLVLEILIETRNHRLAANTILELEFSGYRLPKGRRRRQTTVAIARIVGRYEDRILPVDRASVPARRLAAGRALGAAGAKAHS